MLKWTLLFVGVALLAIPNMALADVSARQDSCVTYQDEAGTTFTRVWFSVINFSLPAPVCGIKFTPEPFPAGPECTMIDCGPPAGWACNLEPGGGASWFANSPADCIPAGGIKTHFNYLLDPGFCCYVVEYLDAAGNVLAEVEECFCDKPVPNETKTWGSIKSQYR